MKTRFAASLVFSAILVASSSVLAVQQADPGAPASGSVAAPQKQIHISEPATVLLKLSKGQVTEEVIVAYIENARRNFDLNADEIVYLKQEGVSDKVVAAALNHHAKIPQATVTVPHETAPAPAYMEAQPQQAPQTVVVTQPQTTYVQAAAPEPTYVYGGYSYYWPFYYSYYPYYYGYYGYHYHPYYAHYGYHGGYSHYGGGAHGWYGGGGAHGGYSGGGNAHAPMGSAHSVSYGGGGGGARGGGFSGGGAHGGGGHR